MALNLRLKDSIEPGKIVNVLFVSSGAIYEATVLSIPGIVGDSYRLKTRDGQIVYVQMFEKMQLVR